MILKKIKILRNKFKQYDIDGYIIPKNDQEMSVHFYTQRDGSFRGVNVILTCER
jgi:Xaa-Pro aminopeptidase